MNELIDGIVNIIGKIPTFVWVTGIALLLVGVGIAFTLVIMVIKYLRKGKGQVLVCVARKTVNKGFSHIKEIMNSNNNLL